MVARNRGAIDSLVKHAARALTSASAGDLTAVELRNVSACARCARGQGCGARLFGQGSAAFRLHCVSEHDVQAEDPVVVEFDDGDASWLWLVAGAYGLPLLGMLLTTILAQAALTYSLLLPETLIHAVGTNGSMTNGISDLVLGAAALTGLSGGVIAWRFLAPSTLARLETRLCLQSGRIVSVGQRSEFVSDSST